MDRALPRVSRVLRRRPAAYAHLRAAGSPAAEREPGGLLQRLCRRCPVAAERVGLGSCPISVIRHHLSRVVQILSLPSGVIPVAGLCVGYPVAPGHVSMRLPLAVTTHTDAYDDTRLSEPVAAYDQRRAARHVTPREKQRDAEIFGYADFYGWSEDKARQAAAREGSGFGAAVRAQGFTLD